MQNIVIDYNITTIGINNIAQSETVGRNFPRNVSMASRNLKYSNHISLGEQKLALGSRIFFPNLYQYILSLCGVVRFHHDILRYWKGPNKENTYVSFYSSLPRSFLGRNVEEKPN